MDHPNPHLAVVMHKHQSTILGQDDPGLCGCTLTVRSSHCCLHGAGSPPVRGGHGYMVLGWAQLHHCVIVLGGRGPHGRTYIQHTHGHGVRGQACASQTYRHAAAHEVLSIRDSSWRWTTKYMGTDPPTTLHMHPRPPLVPFHVTTQQLTPITKPCTLPLTQPTNLHCWTFSRHHMVCVEGKTMTTAALRQNKPLHDHTARMPSIMPRSMSGFVVPMRTT